MKSIIKKLMLVGVLFGFLISPSSVSAIDICPPFQPDCTPGFPGPGGNASISCSQVGGTLQGTHTVGGQRTYIGTFECRVTNANSFSILITQPRAGTFYLPYSAVQLGNVVTDVGTVIISDGTKFASSTLTVTINKTVVERTIQVPIYVQVDTDRPSLPSKNPLEFNFSISFQADSNDGKIDL